MKPGARNATTIPLKMVGLTEFGRYPTISVEQTYNMIVSDGWLVDYAGYKSVKSLLPGNDVEGRGLFFSTPLNQFVVVLNNNVFLYDGALSVTIIGTLDTFHGAVSIAENNAKQIVICDQTSKLYVYNYSNVSSITFSSVSLDFVAGYIAFQDGYLIAPDLNNPKWRLSDLNNAYSWPSGAGHGNREGRFQTKPDTCVACVPFPGKGNLLFVFGNIVSELWVDVGAQLFPYQRVNGINIDYGCLNSETIAALDNLIVWLGASKESGPVILMSNGGAPIAISDDGINFKLSQLTRPQDSFAFIMKQDGHLIYQLTFYTDNFSLAYDFNTKGFTILSDQKLNYHIARKVAFNDNNYYFISHKNGNIYNFSTAYSTLDGQEMPRIRIPPTIRTPDNSLYIFQSMTFPIEQGTDPNNVSPYLRNLSTEKNVLITSENGISLTNEATVNQYVARVDLNISKDGGITFGSLVPKYIRPIGYRKNRMVWWGMGAANSFTPQFRFCGTGRFVVGDGIVNVYQ